MLRYNNHHRLIIWFYLEEVNLKRSWSQNKKLKLNVSTKEIKRIDFSGCDIDKNEDRIKKSKDEPLSDCHSVSLTDLKITNHVYTPQFNLNDLHYSNVYGESRAKQYSSFIHDSQTSKSTIHTGPCKFKVNCCTAMPSNLRLWNITSTVKTEINFVQLKKTMKNAVGKDRDRQLQRPSTSMSSTIKEAGRSRRGTRI